MTIQWKQVTLALITGLLLGAAGVSLIYHQGDDSFHRRPWAEDKRSERMVRYFSRKLDLSEEQKTQLIAILESKREKIRSLNQEMRPRFQEIREATRAEIRSILTPEQQVKFEHLRQAWREKRKDPVQ